MMTRKADIVAARKHNALQVKIQKDQLMGMMEEAKRNGSKATKMITNFLNSQGDAGKKKGRKSGMKRSQSAPGDEPAPLGPKPDAPSLEARLAGEDTGLAPMPYVSPYEVSHRLSFLVSFLVCFPPSSLACVCHSLQSLNRPLRPARIVSDRTGPCKCRCSRRTYHGYLLSHT